ncbi:MAG: ribonuclease III [Kiritimatiellales bacterium]|nr:ribonuclease III [Kiritimatiellales bacterium]
MKPGPRRLEQAIGYRFRKRAHLRLALTHPSYRYENSDAQDDNQRLEFLGDAVLSLTTAEHLYNSCPDLREGDMSKLRSHLTEDRKLAGIAAELGLSSELLLGRGEAGSGGADRASNLADALEAVLGAAWLDGGMRAVRKIFGKVFLPELEILLNSNGAPNPKGTLQEFAQRNGFPVPTYETLAESGPDHDRIFTVEVTACSKSWRAEAGSKREAERLAAVQALEELVPDIGNN